MTIEAKYGGYIDRQAQQVERFRRLEDKPLPADLDYRPIPQLRAEAREKFARVRPRSLGQAGRISGINPADIATLLIHLKRRGPPAESAPGDERPAAADDDSRLITRLVPGSHRLRVDGFGEGRASWQRYNGCFRHWGLGEISGAVHSG